MKFSLVLLLVITVLCLTTPVHAKRRHHPASPAAGPLGSPAPEPPALPTETAPDVDLEAPPSASLQPFLNTHLGKILAPLDRSAFIQQDVVASLKASYADAQAGATAGSRKDAFQAAQGICDALSSAINERMVAAAALRGVFTSRSSEAEQPSGGGEAVRRARDQDGYFVEDLKSNWAARTALLSRSIASLYTRERALERRPDAWPPAARPALAAAPAASPAPGDPDPVLGQWMQEGNPAKFLLGADHGITGERHGSWVYTCTTNAGRNYELSWGGGKWIDYVVLSGDGQVMDGKNKKSQRVLVYRQP